MEAMLKTWKEPVPGSMEPTPVFPPDTTRVIENALIKAKTAALGTQRPPLARPVSAAIRNTPTPPQNYPRYGTPQYQGQSHQNGFTSHQVRSSLIIHKYVPNIDIV